jgi:phage terminase small subunit
MDFLSDEGVEIYKRLEKHCKDKLKMFDIDSLELSMLANSFAMYFDAAKFCKDNGVSMTFQTEKGTYEQIRPEYSVMKNEYQNILKHGAKFGLNPGDRDKVFKGLGDGKEKKKGFDLGNKMKVA